MIQHDVLQEWTRLVGELIDQIRQWATDQGWQVNVQEIERQESELGTYATHRLDIQGPRGHLVVEPKARYVMGADGRVDLYAWPSLNRLLIVRAGDQWKLHTASGVDWPAPWGRDTFVNVGTELMGS